MLTVKRNSIAHAVRYMRRHRDYVATTQVRYLRSTGERVGYNLSYVDNARMLRDPNRIAIETVRCRFCNDTGTYNPIYTEYCTCRTGVALANEALSAMSIAIDALVAETQKCPVCLGEGRFDDIMCPACEGDGNA